MIMKFRDKTPSRRADQKKFADYHEYKNPLKQDFNSHCGYCDDPDRFSDIPYQIDHYVPKAIMQTIAENDYNNLVYACRRCNRAKWDKWPTGDEKISNNGTEGFIDPCNPEYDQQFERNERGEIIPTTPLGEWMWKELDLGNAAHRIIWTLSQIRKEMIDLQQNPHASMDTKIALLCNMYFDLEDQLKGAPQF